MAKKQTGRTSSRATARTNLAAVVDRSAIEQLNDKLKALASEGIAEDIFRAAFEYAAGETFEYLTMSERLALATNQVPFSIASVEFKSGGGYKNTDAWDTSIMINGKLRKFSAPSNKYRDHFFEAIEKVLALRSGEPLDGWTVRLFDTDAGPAWDMLPVTLAKEFASQQADLAIKFQEKNATSESK